MNTNKILTPLKVGNKTAKNRIVMPAMECRLNTIDGSPTQLMIDYYEERAKGGVGMIVVENTFVDNLEARSSVASSGFYSDHQIALKSLLAEAIKDHGTLAVLQLSHGGRQANPAATGLECVAPSPLPCGVVQRMPRELTVAEIERIQDAFADAALRAKKAGFDGIEIHGAHGYLLSEFLSPYANKRKDEYGGSFENRARMPRETIKKVRAKVGRDFIVGYRINVDEYLGDKGLQPAESCRFIAGVQGDIDYVSCSAGNYETAPLCQICSTYIPLREIVPLAAEMKKHVTIPVIAVSSLDAISGEEVLQRGDADLVAYGRQLIADPEFAKKIYEGRLDDIRPCVRANEGCLSNFDLGKPMRCEVNPAAGQEKKYAIHKAADQKRVVIIGGGCAGLEAARVMDLMGHEVILMEKSDHLGGHLIEAVAPPFKEKTKEAFDWMVRQVRKGRTYIQLNADSTPEKVLDARPDAVILAVGSKYIVPGFAGVQYAMYADEALLHQERPGKNIVIIGGGQIGVETGMTLVENRGCHVTIVEMLDGLSYNMDGNARRAMYHRVEKDKIEVRVSHKVKAINPGTVVCEDSKGQEKELLADTVIIAIGLKSNTGEVEKYMNLGVKTLQIGDCKMVRNIYSCFHEAWHAAFNL